MMASAPTSVSSLLYYVFLFLFGYVFITVALASLVGAFQEAKIWKPKTLPSLSLYGFCKVFWLNALWMIFCLLGSIVVALRYILSFGRTDVERETNRQVENRVSRLVIHWMVGDVQVVGREHLPPPDTVPAPVYICNHASQIDVAAVYFFDRRFKWIAKDSVLFMPGVGQVMAMGGHVLINRNKGKNKKSVSNLFEKSNAAVQAGIPMFLFPQGTRRIDPLLPFKDGAFVIAQTNQSALVPISLEIPRNIWNDWYPLSRIWWWLFRRTTSSPPPKVPVVTLTIHKPIPVTGKEDREALKKQCMDQIYSVIPPVHKDDDKKNESAKKEE